MIGAIIGDIVGSRFEFRNHLSKDFELFTDECGFTDDTVMTCAVADALLRCGEWDDAALSRQAVESMQRIGRLYPDCGYGARFIHWMFADNPQPYNSCGNGSAMRVSAVGFLAQSEDEVKRLAHTVTAVTHDHPEGIKGAECTAMCIFLARQGKSREDIRRFVEENYYTLDKSCEDWRRETSGMHGREICPISVPQALECFFESIDFEDCIRNCISIGGDSDTIAAIAGGIAEAFYGVPEELAEKAKTYLPAPLLDIVERFYAAL